MPVQDPEGDERPDEQHQFGHAPESFARILSLQFLKDRLWIFTKKAQESVFQRMLRLRRRGRVCKLKSNRSCHPLIRAIGIALVMLHVNAFVEDLAKADA